jgi:actin-like ATPase involved in cell morphogenesis
MLQCRAQFLCRHFELRRGNLVAQSPPKSPAPAEPEIETEHAAEFVAELRRVADALPERVNVDAESVEQGLARLVLTLIELIRRLLERQAVRRMEGGGLTDRQVEELGLALMRLEEKMAELKTQFGLEDEDLNIDLGPLGRLI